MFDMLTSGAAGVSTSRIISVARINPSACCSCRVMHLHVPLSSSLVTCSRLVWVAVAAAHTGPPDHAGLQEVGEDGGHDVLLEGMLGVDR